MGNIMDDGDEQTTSLDRLNANIAKMEELTQRLMAALSRRRMHDPGLQGPGHDIYVKAATAYVAEMMKNPAKMLEHQVSFWGKSLQHWVEAQRAFSTGETPPQDGTLPQDRRFRNALWDTHPYFHFVKEQYLLSSQTIRDAVQAMRSGAFDFVEKPVEPDQFVRIVERALEHRALRAEVAYLREKIDDLRGSSAMVGSSESIERVRALTAHFDGLIRAAEVSARAWPDHLRGLRALVR